MGRTSFVYDRRYRPYRITLVCRRNMISADLHSYHDFIRLAENHRAKSGNCFSQRKCSSSMQNAERLTGPVIYRHRCLYAVFIGICILNT